ncbi:MAG TPA: hypothetical protein EYN79_05105 [Planctomycetes bacterium]|nr:hypothetical protein [Planctomycetota bacterium]
MKRISAGLLVLVAFLAISTLGYGGSEVGDAAPEVKPGGWINATGPTSWAGFQGKLILIEKWATW